MRAVTSEELRVAMATIAGASSEQLDLMVEAIRDRRRSGRAAAASELRWAATVGARVRFAARTRPTELVGATGVVVGFGKSRAQVQLDRPFGRWTGTIRVPADLLELVSKGEK